MAYTCATWSLGDALGCVGLLAWLREGSRRQDPIMVRCVLALVTGWAGGRVEYITPVLGCWWERHGAK